LSLTLLVENNAKIESFYMLNLSTWLGLEILPKKKGEFALKELQTNKDIKLIVVRRQIEKEESAKLIIEFLKKENLQIPVIVVGPGKEIPGTFATVSNSLQLKPLIQSCAKALNITAKDMSQKVVPDYFPIPVSYFNVIKRSVCPVYSRDIDDPKKYELRIEKLVEIDTALIKKFIEEGVTHLFVDKLQRLEFVNNVTAELIHTLSTEEVSPDEELSIAESGMGLLSKKLLSLGINEETISLAQKNIQLVKKNVKMYPKMAKLLDRLLNNKSSYLFKHTQILTYVGLHIVRNIDWGNPEQEEKISFISFFHDIVLETDEQAQIKTPLELKKANFDTAQKTLVERHAQMAAEFVTKFPHSPMGADQIIRQHHGTLNGLGFSEHYGNNVSPMAIVFIVAEEFTRIILKREHGPFNKEEMIRELKEEFPTSRFQKVIALLETITF
jgi:response regulator RpfG family c-di-GMP phosphodiesterase